MGLLHNAKTFLKVKINATGAKHLSNFRGTAEMIVSKGEAEICEIICKYEEIQSLASTDIDNIPFPQ